MKAKDIKGRLQAHFFLHPTAKLRVRQIERELGAPLPSVIRYARELEKEGILKVSVVGGARLYSADRSSPKFLLEKRLFNIRSLYSSGLVGSLIEEYNNPPIILFGSYARGEDVETSDVDIYVESGAKDEKDLSVFERRLGRKIHVIMSKSLPSLRNKGLANNIINGFVVSGYLEAFR
jgi:predicted nucleotidyltransferase